MQATNIVNFHGREANGIEHGTVIGGGKEGYVVQCTAGTLVATVSFSCLIEPLAGDKILYTRDNEGNSFILSILARPTGPDAVVSFPGDVVLEAAKGRVMIAGASGIDMTSASTLSMLSADVNVAAERAQFNVADTNAAGNSFTGAINKVHLISDSIDTVAKRVTQRAKTCFRWIEQMEHVSAGQMLHSVKNLFSLRSRKSTIKAKDDVKIDGERVHLG